jgi:hypothetical protein
MGDQPELFWHMASVALVREPARLRALGDALDSDPDFRVTHVGRSFPPGRPLTTGFADYLATFQGKLKPAEPEMWFFKRADRPSWHGDIFALDNGRLRHHRAHEVSGAFTDLDWFNNAERIERLSDYLTRLADAIGAFHGYCCVDAMLAQQARLLERNTGSIFSRIFRAARVVDDPEREVKDVYWWNYFGAAYVERWAVRMDGLGVKQVKTPRGARVIWSTDSPFVYKPEMRRVGGYEWKLPFYEALGKDTFMGEGQTQHGAGDLVPTFADHQRVAGVDIASLEGPEPPVVKRALLPRIVVLRERPPDADEDRSHQ